MVGVEQTFTSQKNLGFFFEVDMSRDARKPVFRFPTRSNRPVQPQKMARSLKFRKKRNCTNFVAKMALISCAVIAQLIYAFIFA